MDEIKLTHAEYQTLATFLARVRDTKDLEECLNDYTHNGLLVISSGVSKLAEALRLIGWNIEGVEGEE